MTTIPTVADDEIIATSWGNLVATELNSAAVKKTSTQSMQGPLSTTVGGITSATGLVSTTTGVIGTSLTVGTTATIAGNTQIAGLPSAFDPGIFLAATGGVASRIEDPTSAVTSNMYLEKAGATAGAVGAVFIDFRRTASTAAGGTQCGSVTLLAGGVTVAYNTSSDYRLKDDLGLVVDPVTRLMELKPRHFAWKEDGSEADGFYAHELADVIPYAVTGEKDAVNDDGSINVQQIDKASLIPLLVAAVQELAQRVADLEGS